MKRIVLLFFSLLMLLSLAACGNDEYKYTLSSDYESVIYNLNLPARSKVISGGAFVNLQRNDLYGQEIPDGNKNYECACIFDEETKVLFPLCFDSTCKHESISDCSACRISFYSAPYTYVFRDHVVTLAMNSKKKAVTALYYSLDGTLQKETTYSYSNLLLPDGSEADLYIDAVDVACRYDDKIYIDVMNYDSSASLDYELSKGNTNTIYYHWVLCYDVGKEEFSVAGGFEAPHPYDVRIQFMECTEDKLSFCYADSYYYVIDIATGTTEEIDLNAIVLRLVTAGKITTASYPSVFLPIEGVLIYDYYNSDYTVHTVRHFDINTLEEISPKQDCNEDSFSEFTHNQKSYSVVLTDYETMSYYLAIDSEKTEITGSLKITENRHGTQGTYILGSGGFECENGFVYSLRGEKWVERETRTENGKEVTYILPLEMVYISKEDILDGGEVTPWYYDPESGIFEQK